ncbi:nuclear pore complex protein-related [Euphorbia peplus]|nr:nuclear pore complex protein-related [Euphorbia peplus]
MPFCIIMTVSIDSELYYNEINAIRILQLSWHPFSDTHLGILVLIQFFRFLYYSVVVLFTYYDQLFLLPVSTNGILYWRYIQILRHLERNQPLN